MSGLVLGGTHVCVIMRAHAASALAGSIVLIVCVCVVVVGDAILVVDVVCGAALVVMSTSVVVASVIAAVVVLDVVVVGWRTVVGQGGKHKTSSIVIHISSLTSYMFPTVHTFAAHLPFSHV